MPALLVADMIRADAAAEVEAEVEGGAVAGVLHGFGATGGVRVTSAATALAVVVTVVGAFLSGADMDIAGDWWLGYSAARQDRRSAAAAVGGRRR